MDRAEPSVGSGGASPFSRRSLRVLLGAGGGSLVLALVLSVVTADRVDQRSAGADAFSTSAIGHHGLVALLERLKVPVVVSRHRSDAKAGGNGLLVLCEPRDPAPGEPADAPKLDALEGLVALRTLVVLPKWRGAPSPEHPQWIAEASLLDVERAREVALAALPPSARDQLTIVRLPADRSVHLAPSPDDELLGLPQPSLPGTQLLRGSDALEPVLAGPEGILLARLRGPEDRARWILADPDLLSNHGLPRRDNATLAVRILELAREEGAVVIDETMHGHRRVETVWQELFHFPLVLAIAQALLAVALLLWAGVGRFGGLVAPPPPLPPGKRYLIDHTAELLRQGRHARVALGRYMAAALADAGRALHAPPGLQAEELAGWLDRARSRKDAAALEREVAEWSADAPSARAVALARRIHAWRQEILDGPFRDR